MTPNLSTNSNTPAPAPDIGPDVSVVIPTYREAPNLLGLLRSFSALREGSRIALEVVFMDDRSNDGSLQIVRDFGQPWARMIERDGTRGLSPAVIDGFTASRGRTIVVMDADHSHPVSAVPELLAALDRGASVAVGSRYVQGGGTADDWGVLRWINSAAATMLARPLTTLRDPMSGFFAFRRSLLENAAPLSAIGYKIGLELIVKSRANLVAEIPIQFAQRQAGQSKLSFAEQLKYLEHLRRLYLFKFTRRPRAQTRTTPAPLTVVVTEPFKRSSTKSTAKAYRE